MGNLVSITLIKLFQSALSRASFALKMDLIRTEGSQIIKI